MNRKQLKQQALKLGILEKAKDGSGRPYRHIDNVPFRLVVDFVENEPKRIEAEKARVKAEIDAAFVAVRAPLSAADEALAAFDREQAQERASIEAERRALEDQATAGCRERAAERVRKLREERPQDLILERRPASKPAPLATLADAFLEAGIKREELPAGKPVKTPWRGDHKQLGDAVVRAPNGRFGRGVKREIVAHQNLAIAAK